MSLPVFSTRFKQSLEEARRLALAARADEIGSKDILAAILNVRDPLVHRALSDLRLSEDRLLRGLFGAAALPTHSAPAVDEPLRYEEGARQALRAAIEEASRRRSGVVDTWHLFLAICLGPGSETAAALGSSGADASELAKALERRIGIRVFLESWSQRLLALPAASMDRMLSRLAGSWFAYAKGREHRDA